MKSIFVVAIFVLAYQSLNAQNIKKPSLSLSQLSDDKNKSINQFRNIVYNTIYSPEFRSQSFMPSFAFLKIDINASGNVTDVRFSDSADTLFVKQFKLRKSTPSNEKVLLEQYAKDNSYKDISIIIPVNYEPNYTNKQSSIFYYNQMEALMQFNKKQFVGKAIILAPINIPVLTKGNM
ncbi:MAG: hypothetical protein WC615_10415 [Mucilaginibacter sp.]|jgi:hypothetical protein|uniref:hypothetical protein n=1 Tax=Mucilaginibacter sp. TaxID=1882438 RepID=UPI003567EA28